MKDSPPAPLRVYLPALWITLLLMKPLLLYSFSPFLVMVLNGCTLYCA